MFQVPRGHLLTDHSSWYQFDCKPPGPVFVLRVDLSLYCLMNRAARISRYLRPLEVDTRIIRDG